MDIVAVRDVAQSNAMPDDARLLKTVWAVLYRPTLSDPCRFLDIVEHEYLPSDTIESAFHAIFKTRTGPIEVELQSKDIDDFLMHCYILPDPPCSPTETLRKRAKAYEDKINDDDYLGDHCTSLNGTFGFERVDPKHLENLVLVLTPCLPAPPPSRRLRPISEKDDLHLLREKIASAGRSRGSPSQEATPNRLRSTQNPDGRDAIYNGRPLHLAGTPIGVYHPAFLTFMRVWKGNHAPERQDVVSARKFVRACADFHDSQTERVDAMNCGGIHRAHKSILDAVTLNCDSGPIHPDGVVCADILRSSERPPICITCVRQEIGQGGSDPVAEAQQCYRAFYCSDEATPYRDVSCCPCLIVGIAGPHIMVGGAVFADRILAQSFTDYVYIGTRYTLEDAFQFADAVQRVARLFRALRVTIAELNEYYVSLPYRSSPPYPHIGPHLRRLPMETGGEMLLEYTGRLLDEALKSLFTARAAFSDGRPERDVVVKFVQRYSEKAHRILSEHPDGPLAPRLWFCGKVESVGMYVVVMDHVKDEDDRETMTAAERAQLRKAVRLLHEQNMVFGDLRDANLLLRQRGGLMLVDFDWCGEEGTVRYPYDINMLDGIGWHEDVEGGELIKKEHDLHMLRSLVGDAESFTE